MMARPSGLGACQIRAQCLLQEKKTAVSHDAKATSRPEGEMVADPTMPSTRIVTPSSKLSLSKADFIDFTFLGASENGTKDSGMLKRKARYQAL
jgi:hypothetical protein